MSETDGIEEAIEGQFRVLVTAAGQVGERVAREREAAMRASQSRSEQEARELQARFAAEREMARAQLNRVQDPTWWDNAKREEVADVWQTARAWSKEDPEALRAEQRIAAEVQNRFGMSADDLYARSATERERAVAEEAEARWIMQQGDRDTPRLDELNEPAGQGTARATHQEGHELYDSAERRQGTADQLRSQGIEKDVVATRMRADVSHGKPATEAVLDNTKSRAPKSRSKRGRTPQAQRTGLGR